jgi:hypothetical protein
VTVICGTSQRKPERDMVCIKTRSAAATALGITADTYFYPNGIAVITDDAKLASLSKRCPPNVFHELERLEAVAAKRAAGSAQHPTANVPPVPTATATPAAPKSSAPATTCAKCGRGAVQGANFCSACGSAFVA